MDVRPPAIDITKEPGPRISKTTFCLAFVPVLLAIALMVVYHLVSPSHPIVLMIFKAPLLLCLLNTVFLFVTSCAVSYVAMRAYLLMGSFTVLGLGSGVLMVGTGILPSWSTDLNMPVTVFNISVFGASVFHVVTILTDAMSLPTETRRIRKVQNIVLGYGGVIVAVTLLTLLSLRGVIPAFYVPGAGFSIMRQATLSMAVCLFILSSAYFMIRYVQTRVSFFFWYCQALALLSVGLIAVTLQPAPGSLIGWVGRSAQYISGIYFLVSVVALWRDARRQGVAIGDILANMFRKTDRKLSFIFGSMTDCYYELDRQWHFIRINDRCSSFYRKPRKEFIGRLFFDVFPENRGSIFEEQYKKVFSEIVEAHFDTQSLVSRDRWIEVNAYPTEDGLSVFIRDITDRKQAEETLRKAHEELDLQVQRRTAQLLESQKIARDQMREIEMYYHTAPIGLGILDTNLRYLRINELLAGWNGIPASKHVGKTLREIIPSLADQVERVARQVIETSNPVTNMEITGETPDQPGIRRTWLAGWYPMKDYTGTVVSLSVVVEEVTQQRKLEDELRQSQKMEAIGTLAGGIAHDFNNMLAAILGFTEMALEDLPDRPDVHRNLQNVSRAANRARDLVKQILAFSRKAGHERNPLSLTPLVKETVQLLRASIPTTIEITFVNTATSDTVLASPVEIQQILMNLATNASLAMQDKGGIIEVSLTDIDFKPDSPVFGEDVSPGEYVQLMVKDTGTGMSPDVMKRAFEPFFTTREIGKGTGMGLAAVYGIVKDLQGTITVESELGVGSTLRVSLPKVKADRHVEVVQPDEIPGGNERILFVDDEEMLVEWGRVTLERLGYNVTAMTDSREALKTFSTDPSLFDLVITDHAMPQMAGAQLAIELLNIRRDIPIILCTGHSDSISPESSRELGVKEFLTKPVGKQELAEAVRRVLDHKDWRAR